MVWMKNLLKRMMNTTSKTTSDYRYVVRWDERARRLLQRHVDTLTNTANPKGRVGALEYIRSWNREFAERNRKFRFRRFGARNVRGTFDDADSFLEALKRRGFEFLGSGAFSTVVGKPGKNKVLKINRRPDGWIDYIFWAAKQGEVGKFAPKVYSYKKIKGKKKDFSIAVVERLSYTLEDAAKNNAYKIIPALIWRAKDNDIAATFADMLVPGLTQFVRKIEEKFKKDLDLHDGNLMVRNDGTFVVVDPIASANADSGTHIRLRAGDFSPAVVFRTFYERRIKAEV